MGVLVTILTVLLVILSVILVLLILLQSDKSSGMGILGGGGSGSAFGSSTADVMTKITGFLVAIFLLTALGLSIIEAHRPKSVVDTLPKEEQKGNRVESKKKSEADLGGQRSQTDKAPKKSAKPADKVPSE